MMFKSKDFFIIKLRYYASEYYLKKFHNGDPTGRIKHSEAANRHMAFLYDFIHRVTGHTLEYYTNRYGHRKGIMFNMKEKLLQRLIKKYNIVVSEGEGWYTYHIPKGETELIEWVIKETSERKIPSKQLKRSRSLEWYNYFYK